MLGVAVSGLTPARIGDQGDEKQDGPGREKWPESEKQRAIQSTARLTGSWITQRGSTEVCQGKGGRLVRACVDWILA